MSAVQSLCNIAQEMKEAYCIEFLLQVTISAGWGGGGQKLPVNIGCTDHSKDCEGQHKTHFNWRFCKRKRETKNKHKLHYHLRVLTIEGAIYSCLQQVAGS